MRAAVIPEFLSDGAKKAVRMENHPTQNVNETKVEMELEKEKEAVEKPEPEPEAEATEEHSKETIIDIPAAAVLGSSNSHSSSYDTDCSTASSTCCTRQGEHIYMQRDPIPDTHHHHLPEAEDLGLLKYEHRKHWPWFILVISIIEVSTHHFFPSKHQIKGAANF